MEDHPRITRPRSGTARTLERGNIRQGNASPITETFIFYSTSVVSSMAERVSAIEGNRPSQSRTPRTCDHGDSIFINPDCRNLYGRRCVYPPMSVVSSIITAILASKNTSNSGCRFGEGGCCDRGCVVSSIMTTMQQVRKPQSVDVALAREDAAIKEGETYVRAFPLS